MAPVRGCHRIPAARKDRGRGILSRLWRGTREWARGLISAISRGLNGRTLWTRRGSFAAFDSQPRSRKAASSQHPRVRRAAFTGTVYRNRG